MLMLCVFSLCTYGYLSSRRNVKTQEVFMLSTTLLNTSIIQYRCRYAGQLKLFSEHIQVSCYIDFTFNLYIIPKSDTLENLTSHSYIFSVSVVL